ncbi:YraN family protein [uncultured Shewanella sp.]|uniref:YraN family protein n=1 Tax=Shewanella atlantica TaxID=271099 RepID=UPI002607271F|nr:YraN family protein [uncultured Shewanella sp.]
MIGDDKSKVSTEHGQTGERLALEYLTRQGLTFIEQNVRYRFGEIDLVMKDGKEWIFVEVKYRSKNQYGGALNALSSGQLKRLRRAAEHYMQINNIDASCRFDLIAIDAGQIQWLPNAF